MRGNQAGKWNVGAGIVTCGTSFGYNCICESRRQTRWRGDAWSYESQATESRA